MQKRKDGRGGGRGGGGQSVSCRVLDPASCHHGRRNVQQAKSPATNPYIYSFPWNTHPPDYLVAYHGDQEILMRRTTSGAMGEQSRSPAQELGRQSQETRQGSAADLGVAQRDAVS